MHRNNLLILLTFIFVRSALAGLTQTSYRIQGFDCKSSGIELSESLKPSLEEISEASFKKISSTSLSDFKKSPYPQIDLETWIYIQNATRYILKALNDKKNEYRNLLTNTYKTDHSSEFINYKNNYNLATSLMQSFKNLDKANNLCSSWKFWNIPERIYRGINCNTHKYNKLIKLEVDNLLKELKDANPYLLHPIIESGLINNELAQVSLPIFFRNSISEIEKQEAQMKKVQNYSASQENLSHVLNDTSVISTLAAFNYKPSIKKINKFKTINLTKAKCIIEQKHLANNSDKAFTQLGWNIFQVVFPLAVYGKANFILKSLKSAKNFIKAKQNARGAIVVSEALILNLDTALIDRAHLECKNIQKNAAKLNLVPNTITRQLRECKELADSLTTSKYLALLGSGVAIKLSKYDLQNMRLDRILNQGKKLINTKKSIVTSALIKQADIINAQIESLIPQPSMAISSFPSKNSTHLSTPAKPSHLTGTLSLNRLGVTESYKVFKETIENFDCRGRRQCKKIFAKIKNGLFDLGKFGEEGQLTAYKVLKLIRTQDFFRLNKSLQTLYQECLTILKCTHKEFNILFRMNKIKLSHTPHLYYYKRILNAFRLDQSPKDIIRNLTILEKMKLNPKNGEVSGAFNRIEETEDCFIINGKKSSKFNEDAHSYKLSMERENEAFKLLAKKGFKVAIIPESAGRREQEGIQHTFARLAKAEKIGPTKNPDVILNGQYIADIYSPLQGLNPNNLRNVSSNILKKIEGKPKKTNSQNGDKSENFRQTNRVVVYVDNIEGDPYDLVDDIRQMIGYEEPKHIVESFLIFEKEGQVETINIWP